MIARRGARALDRVMRRGLVHPLLICVVVAVFAGACAPTGAATAASGGPGAVPEAPMPSIEQGDLAPGAEGRSASLLGEAREALARGEHTRAREAARRIVTDFPRAPGSVEALFLLGEASFALEEYEEAEAAAGRYAAFFTPDHRRWGPALLLRAESLVRLDRQVDALAVLLENESGLLRDHEVEALALVRENVRDVETEALADLIEVYEDRVYFLAPVLAEYAVALHFAGESEREEARRISERVLALAPGTPESEVADAVLSGDAEGLLGTSPMIAALLPATGSPALNEFGRLIGEGVRLAIDMDTRRHRLPVALEVVDDEGRPERGAQLARELQQRGAFGFVGPLLDPAVDAVARALSGSVPIVSPTARMLPRDFSGIYSLSSVDPAAALLLAEYVEEAGFERIAVVYPRSPEASEEARIFTDSYRRAGRGFVSEITYAPGQTSFAETMLQVEEMGADALVLPLGPDDIEIFAPQITFFGVDTLGVQVLGTSAWALDDVLSAVSRRHTDNVIVATPRRPGGVRPEYQAFTEAYEEFHQKSLVSRVPALGFDAAGLLLEAFRVSQARNAAELRAALERIRDYPGATGTLSVIDGRIVREHTLVRLDNRRMVPLSSRPPGPAY